MFGCVAGKAGEQAAQDVAVQMIANMEAKAKEAEEEQRKRREQSKLNDHKPHVDVWGEDTAQVDMDDKKVSSLQHMYGIVSESAVSMMERRLRGSYLIARLQTFAWSLISRWILA